MPDVIMACTVQSPCLLLLVDDEETVRLLFMKSRGVFIKKGLDLLIADSLSEAFEMLGKYSVMIVLLDLKLPGESDGAETVKRIRERTSAPIFGFSGAVDSSLRDLCINYGADDLLLKGAVQLEDLAGVLSKAASNYRNSLKIERRFNSLLGH